MRRHPVLTGVVVGVLGYWAFQHFTGAGTSGKGAQQSPGGLKPSYGG